MPRAPETPFGQGLPVGQAQRAKPKSKYSRLQSLADEAHDALLVQRELRDQFYAKNPELKR